MRFLSNISFVISFLLTMSVTPTFAQGNLDERRSLAEQGDAKVQFELGQAYHYGIGVDRDLSEAIRWYEMAANQDDAAAMFELGSLVYRGFDPADKSPEAVQAAASSIEWYHKASGLGSAQAQSTIGLLYGFGDHVEMDQIKGRMWLFIAQDNGSAPSPMLGMLENRMSEDELAEARLRADTCLASDYADCD